MNAQPPPRRPGAIWALALALGAALLLAPTVAYADRSAAASAYEIGRRAYHQGDFLTAKVQFLQVLEHQPDHYPTKVMLKQCNLKLAADTGRELRAKLAQIIIPKVDFDEVELGTALEFLSNAAAKATGDKFRPSFVVRGEKTENRTLTLRVAKLPLSEVLRYVGDLTSVNLHYEKHAVVATPMSTGADGGVARKKSEEVAGQ